MIINLKNSKLKVTRKDGEIIAVAGDKSATIEVGDAAGESLLAALRADGEGGAWLAGHLAKFVPPAAAFSRAVDVATWRAACPFPAAALRWRKGAGNKELCYIRGRDVTGRLDVVYPGWSREVDVIDVREIPPVNEKAARQWAVSATTTLIVGTRRVKAIGADVSYDYTLSFKSAGTDSLKRAAALLGIGAYLSEIPSKPLPAWATPAVYQIFYPEPTR